MSLDRPEDYAQTVRRVGRYGPVQVVAGVVTAWFHGPHGVLTVHTVEGGEVTLAVDARIGDLSTDLAQLFRQAADGHACELNDPGRLTLATAPGVLEPPQVTRFSVRVKASHPTLVIGTSAGRWQADVAPAQLDALAGALALWCEAIGSWWTAGTPTARNPAGAPTARIPAGDEHRFLHPIDTRHRD